MTASVWATTDDRARAQEIAERLWNEERRKAIVLSVSEMHRMGHPLAPRTVNRWAVIVKSSR